MTPRRCRTRIGYLVTCMSVLAGIACLLLAHGSAPCGPSASGAVAASQPTGASPGAGRASGSQPAYRPDGRGGVQNALKAGQDAPDFTLSVLTIETGADGNTVGKVSDKTVKLSSFKGKKPVCLIFSSYT